MPSVVTFGNDSTITYFYAADGTKVRTVHVINGATTQTDYCGNVIYENGAQKLLLTEEGYVDLTNSTYHYYLKDHQGNNRVVIDGSGTVKETNHYYPFGGLFASTSVQPFKYNGKEFDSKNGLNWYDYGARHYDATLGRWHVVDPLADKYYGYSPYAYCYNNPLKYIDPDGKDGILITFPDYKIEVYGFKVPYLGHAGVLLIDNETGKTKYYEYGRYDKENKGIVRNMVVPNVKVDDNGKPTLESLENVLESISNKSGQGGCIEGAYIESDSFNAMNEYAEDKVNDNSNPDRKSYSLLNYNCATFAIEVLNQDSKVEEKTPAYRLQIPNYIIKEYQKVSPRIIYDSKKNK